MADDVKEFTTSAKAVIGNTVTFKVDGRELTAHRPKDATLLMVSLDSRSDNPAKQMQSAIKFLDGCLGPEDRDWIASRLRDPDDDFDLAELTEVFRFVIEEVVGSPTESQSD